MLDMLKSQVDALQQLPVGSDEIADDSHHEQEQARDDAQGTEDHGLYVTLSVVFEQVPQKARASDYPGEREDRAEESKELQRLVDNENTKDRGERTLHIARDAFHQSRWPQVCIGADRNRDDPHVALASLDDRLERVGVGIEHVQPHRRLA